MAERPYGEGGAQRLVAAAIRLFGERGVKGTSLKAIAAEAGVSPALIVHHFGSKEGLQRACDEHLLEVVRTNKQQVIATEARMDPLAVLGQIEQSRPLLRYLARTLTDGGAHVTELIDEMVADAEDYLGAGEEAGLIKPSATPRERVVVLVIWALGALALHEHVHRLLGVDFLETGTGPAGLAPYLRPVLELYAQGLAEEGAFSQLIDLVDATDTDGPDGPERTKR